MLTPVHVLQATPQPQIYQNVAIPPLHDEVLESATQTQTTRDFEVSPLWLGLGMVLVLVTATLIYYGRLTGKASRHPDLETLREIDADPALSTRSEKKD
jgi:hypothetical protein